MKMKAVKRIFIALSCVVLMAPLFEGALASQKEFKTPGWLKEKEGGEDAYRIYLFVYDVLQEQKKKNNEQEGNIDNFSHEEKKRYMDFMPKNLADIFINLNAYSKKKEAANFILQATRLKNFIKESKIRHEIDDLLGGEKDKYEIAGHIIEQRDPVEYIMNLREEKPVDFESIMEELRQKHQNSLHDFECQYSRDELRDDFDGESKNRPQSSMLSSEVDVGEQLPPLDISKIQSKQDNVALKLHQQQLELKQQQNMQTREINLMRSEQQKPSEQELGQVKEVMNSLKLEKNELIKTYAQFNKNRDVLIAEQKRVLEGGQKNSEAYKLALRKWIVIKLMDESSKLEYNKERARLMEAELAKLEEEKQTLDRLSEALQGKERLNLEKEKLKKELPARSQKIVQSDQKLFVQPENMQTLEINLMRNEQQKPSEQELGQVKEVMNSLELEKNELTKIYAQFITSRNVLIKEQKRVLEGGQKNSEAYKLALRKWIVIKLMDESSKLEYNKERARLMEAELAKLEEEKQTLDRLSEALQEKERLNLEKEKLKKELAKKQQKK